jgi:Smg protein
VYEILVYLFENCQRSEVSSDRGNVAKKLAAAGFEDTDIDDALSWLAGVVRGPQRMVEPLPRSGRALRAYAPRELAKLDAGCRGFLLQLEQQGLLDPRTREHVIERALAVAEGPLGLEELKLVVLMVLWSEQAPTFRLFAEDLVSRARPRLPN